MLHFLRVTYTDNEPMRPDDADIGIKISFDRGASDPVKVFSAMTDMLSAFRTFDELLYNAVDPSLQPIMVLEDVEAASMTSWIRNKLNKIDDGALKEFSIKQQIGSYAVKAKYRIIQYLDEHAKKEERDRLAQLQGDLYKLAQEHATGTFPLPDRIPLKQLAAPMDQFQAAKQKLGKGEAVTIRSDLGDRSVDLSETKRPSDYIKDAGETKATGTMQMTLLIRKPDMLGNSLWEFKHGKTAINAHIEDEDWMTRYRNGLEPLVPGASMLCDVRYEYEYDKAGALLSASHDIVTVHRILAPSGGIQGDFLDDQ